MRPKLSAAAGHGQGWIAALTLVVAIGVVIAVVLTTSSPAPSRAAGTPAVTGAATVLRRDLVSTDTEAGTLSYSGAQTVYDRLSGTVTWLPSVGDMIKPGGTLFRVDGAPVTLLDGSTPAYRTLSAADADGADITELNRNLVRLGFDPDGLIIDDVWQPATTTGVELLQESLGETATGILSIGEVVFLPGDQLISTVDGTVGAGSGSGAASTHGPAAAPAPEFVSLRSGASTTPTTTPTTPPTTGSTTTTTTSTSSTASPTHKPGRQSPSPATINRQTLAALAALLRAESAQLRAETAQLNADRAAAKSGKGGSPKSSSPPSSSTPSGTSGGDTSGGGSSGGGSSGGGSSGGGSSGTAILQTTSTHLVVTVDLSASSQSEAKVGERVTVELPAGNTVGGRITAVSPVAQSSSNSGNGSGSGGGNGNSNGNGNGGGSGGSSSTIPVTIRLSGHHRGAGLDQAAVSVNFAQQRARNVLSVPVTALVATSGNSYNVQTAATPHRLIPVTTGLFAAGYVQISGPGVYAGLAVTDSQG